MGLVKNFFKRFDRKQCYFYQNKRCILHYKVCRPCNSHIRKINGIDSPSEYFNFITNKNNNRATIFLTLISLIISLSAVYITIFEDKIKSKIVGKDQQIPTTTSNLNAINPPVIIVDSINVPVKNNKKSK